MPLLLLDSLVNSTAQPAIIVMQSSAGRLRGRAGCSNSQHGSFRAIGPLIPRVQRCTRARQSACRAGGQARLDAQVCVVLGTQWGDEGKGKLVDILAQQYDVVARAQVSC